MYDSDKNLMIDRNRPALWPLLTALVILWGASAYLIIVSVRLNDGRWVYALDDPYIHMTLAKHVALSGTWGVTGNEFNSASSSLLWTLLLSGGFLIFGVHETHALVLNGVFAVLTLVAVFRIARRHGMAAWSIFVLLLAIIVLTPIPTLILEGLEHNLQIVLNLAFASVALSMVARDDASSFRQRGWCVLLAALVVMVRYEGMFLVFVTALLMFLRGRWATAVILGLAGFVPIAVFGVWSVQHGEFFFPNSVLLKALSLGGLPGASGVKQILLFLTRVPRSLDDNPHLLILLAASLLLLSLHLRGGRFRRPAILWNTLFVAVAVLHLQFAGMGWFFRYESYLMALGLVAIAIALRELPRPLDENRPVDGLRWIRRSTLLISGAVLAIPLVSRGLTAFHQTPRATANIYQQQYQMGLFFQEYYGREAVAVNDIGAVSFLHDGPLLDLVGLGNMPIARARLAGKYDTRLIIEQAEKMGVVVAALYENWFADTGIPASWKKVGEWTIPERVSASHKTVSFYAVQAEEETRLAGNLRSYAKRLPRAVTQKGAYLELAAPQKP